MSPEILFGIGVVGLLAVLVFGVWRNRRLSAEQKEAGDRAVRERYHSNTPTRAERGGDRAV